jgi:hypothetical protein
MAVFDTVANVVSDAAVELGLDSVSDVYAASDANVIQLRTLLKTVGRGLQRMRRWSHLTFRTTFSTGAGGNITQALATDFDELAPCTLWDTTNDRELHGPVSEPVWEFLQATGLSTSLHTPWRIWQGALYLFAAPASATIAYEYRSTWWVAVTAAPTKTAPTLNSDVLMFDRNLMLAALKLAWLRLKGFDTTAAADEYRVALQQATAGDAPGRVLSMTGRGPEPLLGAWNIPVTGIGS